jgi:hypothetical protein
MTLSSLPVDIRTLAIRLPYRAGLFISRSDSSGGGASDEAELLALTNVVTYYVEDFCKSEFAQSVMLETLRHKPDWVNWGENIENTPQECRQVFDALTGQVDMRDIVAFKNNLLEIAIAVAMAYREFDSSEPLTERFKIYLDVMMRQLKAMIKGQVAESFDQMLNISRSEKAAINQLAQTLDIQYKVG